MKITVKELLEKLKDKNPNAEVRFRAVASETKDGHDEEKGMAVSFKSIEEDSEGVCVTVTGRPPAHPVWQT